MKFTIRLQGMVKTLLGCTVIFYSASALAATYYVSPTGSAAWGPSCQTPVTGTAACSLASAGANAVADDIVYLRAGTYNLPHVDGGGELYFKSGFAPSHSGTSGHPVTFSRYGSEVVFFNNSANAGQANHVTAYSTSQGESSTHDYIVFDGIDTDTVANAEGNGYGAALHATTGSIIRNAKIKGVSGSSSISTPIMVESTSNCQIYNNDIYGSTGTDNSVGILIYFSDNLQIFNNNIHDNTQGLYDKAYNVNMRYYKNFIYNNANVGIGIAGESAQPGSNGTLIYQNILLNNYDQFRFYGGMAAHDCDVYNNTIVGAKDLGINFVSDYLNFGFWNNLFYGNAITGAYNNSQTVDYNNYNQYYSTGGFKWPEFNGIVYTFSQWQAQSGWDANSNTNNPNFVNASGTAAADYKRSSYPTVGKAGGVIGAYITGSETIGYSSGGNIATSPSVPNSNEAVTATSPSIPKGFQADPIN